MFTQVAINHTKKNMSSYSGIDLSITIDEIRVFINKMLSTESLINQLLIRGLSYQLLLIVGNLGQGMRSCKCTNHDLHTGECQ